MMVMMIIIIGLGDRESIIAAAMIIGKFGCAVDTDFKCPEETVNISL